MTEPVYSPGLEGIIAGETAVSTIAGGLKYRGYAIEVLACGHDGKRGYPETMGLETLPLWP